MIGNKDHSLAKRLSEARAILGLPEVVSFIEVQQAYRTECLKCHPDLVDPAKRDEATHRMQQLNTSYDLLRRFFFNYPVSLREEEVEKYSFEMKTWWWKRFGEAF